MFYEIYRLSLPDSDGISDLNSITSGLDYLRCLGVDAIWRTPMFPSSAMEQWVEPRSPTSGTTFPMMKM